MIGFHRVTECLAMDWSEGLPSSHAKGHRHRQYDPENSIQL